MPIRTDDSGRRWVELELLVPGTPEQVWHALATGPGNAAWFVRGEIEPRQGGTFKLDFGNGAVSSGEVTTWQPPNVFGYVERDWQQGAPPIATEVTITGRSGHCVVRMVHSLFTSSAEWDDQVEGFERGWPSFFGVLRVYLAHFAGAPASSFMVMQPSTVDAPHAWAQLTEALGVSGANVGDRRSVTAGPEPLSGVVEQVYQDPQLRWVLLRIDEPSPGIVVIGTLAPYSSIGDMEAKVGMGSGTNVSVNRYFYGSDAGSRSGESETAWREWLAQTFESPAAVS